MALFVTSFIFFFGYSYLTRPERATDATSPAASAVPPAQQAETSAEPTASVTDSAAASSPTAPVDAVAKWMAEATAADPRTRAAAIDALAAAPRSLAAPIFQKVLNSGEPMDRQFALRSLHTLALQQGDDDGGIRRTLRLVIYDGGDEDVARDAQVVLDDIESGLDRTASSAGR